MLLSNRTSTLWVRAVAAALSGPWLQRWHGWLLVGLWGLMHLVLLAQNHGPRFIGDSSRYLAYAQQIADNWHFKGGHNLRYVGYPLFMALWLKLGTGWWGIVFGQLALNALATIAFYHTLRRLVARNTHWLPAALATAVLIAWRDLQQYNWFLLTESVFTSLLMLCLWALVRLQTGVPGRWLVLGALLILAGIVRPNGFVVAAAAVLTGLVQLWQRPGRRGFWSAMALLALLAPVAWWVLNRLLFTFTLIETYLRGELNSSHIEWVVAPTAPLLFPPEHLAPVLRLGYFIGANPFYFTKLALLKGIVFFGCVKSYYSWLHVASVVVVIYPSYWLALRGLRSSAVWLPARVFMGAMVGLQAGVVMLTIDDWDGRFLLPLLPCIFALAGLAVADWLTAQPSTQPSASKV